MDELIESLPDIHQLFLFYDQLYFCSRLQTLAVVEWSDRMTRCAGICYCRAHIVTIRLSRKLLQYRPFRDTINTLLHEMIHAYLHMGRLFLGAADIDRDSHGPAFLQLMDKINALSGSSVTVHHSFADEVQYQQKHVWRCNGRCRNEAPFYGWVRRAMNRPPQPADRWFKRHADACGGCFVKAAGPGPSEGHSPGQPPALECPVCHVPFGSNISKLSLHVEQYINLYSCMRSRKCQLQAVPQPLCPNDSFILDCSYNQIQAVDIGRIRCRELILSYNELTFVSIQETNVFIEYLDLSHNHIASLPDTFCTFLPNLRCLKLQGNNLAALPRLDCLARLEELWVGDYLGGNLIADLPALPASVKILQARGNKLTALPTHAGLEDVDVSENVLTRLPYMESIRILKAAANKLTHVGHAWLDAHGRIRLLDVTANSIARIPERPATIILQDPAADDATTHTDAMPSLLSMCIKQCTQQHRNLPSHLIP